MKRRGIEKENSFVWLVKAPFHLLRMARDAYIRSITSCSGTGILTGGGSSGFGRNFQICEPPSTALPRSLTLTSRDQEGCMTRGGQLTTATAMRQSASLDHRRKYRYVDVVVMRRIDEEISCGDD
ncbi:hypothetical protein V5N11_031128 [Cardamine amara subsp. amara]|uniref:Uncharacterized protein n=1 Tax=Cardamine amara subsp. amara TaxID=228776 RepID=A0ABD0ZLX3_CARAN